MRKAELVTKISERTGIPKVDILVTVENMLKEIKNEVSKGEGVTLRGFGTFYAKKRASKVARNIRKNVAINLPEHFIPGFKPSKEFHSEVKNNYKSTKI